MCGVEDELNRCSDSSSGTRSRWLQGSTSVRAAGATRAALQRSPLLEVLCYLTPETEVKMVVPEP